MKSLIAVLLAGTIAWHILAEAAVYISFKINQDYIEKYLCVNRDNPESECHGCCQLEKEMKKQQETKSNMPDTQLKKIEIQYFPTSLNNLKLFPSDFEKHIQPYQYPRYSKAFKEIFHPPRKLLL